MTDPAGGSELDDTVAVKAADWPAFDGLGDEVRPVELACEPDVTTCVMMLEELAGEVGPRAAVDGLHEVVAGNVERFNVA